MARADSHAEAIDRSTIDAVSSLVRASRLDEALCMADAHVVQNPGAAALLPRPGAASGSRQQPSAVDDWPRAGRAGEKEVWPRTVSPFSKARITLAKMYPKLGSVSTNLTSICI